MKYIVPVILLIVSVFLSTLTTYCSYLSIMNHWTWLFVAIGIGFSATVAWLATSAAFSAVRDW